MEVSSVRRSANINGVSLAPMMNFRGKLCGLQAAGGIESGNKGNGTVKKCD